jgi:hypothetical protein
MRAFEGSDRAVRIAVALTAACPMACGGTCYETVPTLDDVEGNLSYSSATLTTSGMVHDEPTANIYPATSEVFGYQLSTQPGGSFDFGYADADFSLVPLPSPGTYALQDLPGACLSESPCGRAEPPDCGLAQGPQCLPLTGTLVVTTNSRSDCRPGSGECGGGSCPPVCLWSFEAQLTLASDPGAPAQVSGSLIIRHSEKFQTYSCSPD